MQTYREDEHGLDHFISNYFVFPKKAVFSVLHGQGNPPPADCQRIPYDTLPWAPDMFDKAHYIGDTSIDNTTCHLWNGTWNGLPYEMCNTDSVLFWFRTIYYPAPAHNAEPATGSTFSQSPRGVPFSLCWVYKCCRIAFMTSSMGSTLSIMCPPRLSSRLLHVVRKLPGLSVPAESLRVLVDQWK